MGMFCFQCEQTAKGKGCNTMGVCGKTPEVATLQDLLIHATKGIAIYAHMARELGVKDKDTDLFVIQALFALDLMMLSRILLFGGEKANKSNVTI